ncbi:lysozyme, partial [Acinetobacter bereziniae]|uniref:lysozyme n=1 Tax=Acinetobacter bereziniae TaxID=106648 RepID=UPI0032B36960
CQLMVNHLNLNNDKDFGFLLIKSIKNGSITSQNQFDALVSLAYNIGINAFQNSTLLKRLNALEYLGAAQQFDVWIKAGGKTVQGLVNRRAVEKALFLKH